MNVARTGSIGEVDVDGFRDFVAAPQGRAPHVLHNPNDADALGTGFAGMK